MTASGFNQAAGHDAETLIELALAEDLGRQNPSLAWDPGSAKVAFVCRDNPGVGGDLTADAIIPRDATGSARFTSRAEGVVSGLPVVGLVASRFGLPLGFRPLVHDGERIEPGQVLGEVAGPMRALLAFERTALNFLQHLSGIATLTAQFVAEVAGTKAKIFDTRKTTPGWRALEKYAVRCGGGSNHRNGLYDAVLIKDNHLAWLESLGNPDPIGAAIAAARAKAPEGTVIEVEVDSLEQFDRALECGPDIVLVDNLGAEALAEAVRRRDAKAPGVLIEASGGVSLRTVAGLARSGVDRISVGALTHSAPSLDVGLDFGRSRPA